MTLGIVKRTEEEFADWLGTEWGFISGLAAFDEVEALAGHEFADDARDDDLVAPGERCEPRGDGDSVAVEVIAFGDRLSRIASHADRWLLPVDGRCCRRRAQHTIGAADRLQR